VRGRTKGEKKPRNKKIMNEITMKMSKTKKSVLVGLTVGAVSLALALPQAQANPTLTGSIGFAGSLSVPSGKTLANTTELDDINTTVVGSPSPPTGSFPTSLAGAVAAFANPLFLTTSASYIAPFQLWSVTSGGNTYAFEATSETILLQSTKNGGILDLVGNGFATINGLDATDGTWSLTVSASGSGPTVTFALESTATVLGVPVPDAGMTLTLLGSVIAGLVCLRSKFGSKLA
jgi:hypothetical protein